MKMTIGSPREEIGTPREEEGKAKVKERVTSRIVITLLTSSSFRVFGIIANCGRQASNAGTTRKTANFATSG